ncbi:sporulation lipoprotein YhcN/YlaJ [Melghirimyces profundicolus]|uniref:Sporulation lipoprotein YhcN/YlaJ n=1 Tax=Melghirimyces profundicolus TaxID=1242148 RepID=A0A2T6BSK5_9BACL|nr:YhcN/YlaJ family sporulation lipoprotein [Melghirimyces profundicolus]PTX59075.1 sporulation lipoprotein YhcN/YlaJ [Melghirimyces profundicolus]
MKRYLFPVMALFLALSACAPAERPNDGYDESLNPDTQNGAYDYVTNKGRRPRQNFYNEIGFSRQKGREYYNATDGGAVPGPDVYINRSALARQISSLSTRLPTVDDATVVVTDDKVFIGVKNNKGNISDDTLYEVRRTAWSLTPRYYQVYVTKNDTIRKELMNIGRKAGNAQQNHRLNKEEMEDLVDRMDRGYPMKKHIPDNPSPGNVVNPND